MVAVWAKKWSYGMETGPRSNGIGEWTSLWKLGMTSKRFLFLCFPRKTDSIVRRIGKMVN